MAERSGILMVKAHSSVEGAREWGAQDVLRTLQSGGVIAFPCPVGYVLGTSSARGVQSIFELKGRESRKPLSLAGRVDVEAGRYLRELRDHPVGQLGRVRTTMGLLGTCADSADALPEGVGARGSLVVFVNLGSILEEVLGELDARAERLYVTSCNRAGAGNTYSAGALDPRLADSLERVFVDDACVTPGTHGDGMSPGSPIWDLRRGVFVRDGLGQASAATQLFAAGLAPAPQG